MYLLVKSYFRTEVYFVSHLIKAKRRIHDFNKFEFAINHLGNLGWNIKYIYYGESPMEYTKEMF